MGLCLWILVRDYPILFIPHVERKVANLITSEEQSSDTLMFIPPPTVKANFRHVYLDVVCLQTECHVTLNSLSVAKDNLESLSPQPVPPLSEIAVYTTTPCLCGTGDQTQGSLYTRKAPCPLSHISSPLAFVST